MLSMKQHDNPAMQRSFLPEDYVQGKLERRTNLIAITLFSVVTVGVIGAFLVTNRQWHDVKHYQEAINVRYAQAAKDIEQLKQLEDQKSELLEKAELTTALIERVPRSLLLAELINRMPLDVTLLELEAKSTRIIEQPTAASKDEKKPKEEKPGTTSRRAKGEKEEAKPVVTPPRYETKLAIVGVTNTHNSVAKYVTMLQQCGLLSDVELKFSEKTIIENRDMNKFRIEAQIRPDADARGIEPLSNPRLASPAAPARESTADASPIEGGER